MPIRIKEDYKKKVNSVLWLSDFNDLFLKDS